MNESKLDQAAAKAVRAQNLLDNELLAETFQELEDSYTAAWRATTIDDVGAREKLFLAINIVGTTLTPGGTTSAIATPRCSFPTRHRRK